jgi:membrane-associated phospholipid phosphatase
MSQITRRLVIFGVAAALCYALLWFVWVLHSSWLDTVDSLALDPLHRYGVKHPAWVRSWDEFCTFGPSSFRLAGAVVIVVAIFRRNLRVVLFVLTTIGFSGVLTQIAKNLSDRPRPDSALVFAPSTAFPSGHAVEVTAAVLALLTVSTGVFGRRARLVTVTIGAFLIVAIGVGRVVLNVHHPSDVLAGWALGYLWFLLWLFVIRPLPLAAPAIPEEPVSAEEAGRTPEVPDTER